MKKLFLAAGLLLATNGHAVPRTSGGLLINQIMVDRGAVSFIFNTPLSGCEANIAFKPYQSSVAHVMPGKEEHTAQSVNMVLSMGSLAYITKKKVDLLYNAEADGNCYIIHFFIHD